MCVYKCFPSTQCVYENVNCFAWSNLISSSRKQKVQYGWHLLVRWCAKIKCEQKKKLWYNLFLNIGKKKKKNKMFICIKLTAKVVYQLLNSSHRWRNINGNAHHFYGFCCFFFLCIIATDIQLIIAIANKIIIFNFAPHLRKVCTNCRLKCNKNVYLFFFSLIQ